MKIFIGDSAKSVASHVFGVYGITPRWAEVDHNHWPRTTGEIIRWLQVTMIDEREAFRPFCTISEVVVTWLGREIRRRHLLTTDVELIYVDDGEDESRIMFDIHGELVNWPGRFMDMAAFALRNEE